MSWNLNYIIVTSSHLLQVGQVEVVGVAVIREGAEAGKVTKDNKSTINNLKCIPKTFLWQSN